MKTAHNSALVIIDIQGNLAQLMHDKENLFKNVQLLIRGAQLLNIPIIWTEQLPDKLGETTQEIGKLLSSQKPIVKDVFSCARNGEFNMQIEKIQPEHIMLAGIETHICVYQTASDLLGEKYQVEIVSDATSSRTQSNKKIGLEKIKHEGGCLTSVETLLFEIQGTATGEQFRELIKLIKKFN